MRTRLALGMILSLVIALVAGTAVGMPRHQPRVLSEGSLSGWRIAEAAPESAPSPLAPDTGKPPGTGEPDGWTLTQTSVSTLNSEEKAELCGVPLEVLEWEESQAGEETVTLSASYSYPPTLDWRSEGDNNWTTPIRDQRGCSSCAAFATAAAIESRLELNRGEPNLNPDLSEAHLFYCGCGGCCGSGWYPNAAMDFARDTGLVDEACYPYTPGNQACTLCQGWQDRLTTISSWEGTTSVDEMKQALADNGPFLATMRVYSDFFDYGGGVYHYTWGELEGGHAVGIVGYNDYQGYWIAKNSWGTGWGESGWFRIAYGECAIDSYAYVPTISDPSYHVSVNPSPDGGGVVDVTPSDCAIETCEPGTQAELVASPSPDWEFTGWSGDVLTTTNPITITVDADKTVIANFTYSCDDCLPRAFVPLVMCP